MIWRQTPHPRAFKAVSHSSPLRTLRHPDCIDLGRCGHKHVIHTDMETQNGVRGVNDHHVLLGNAADITTGAAVAEGGGDGGPLPVEVNVASAVGDGHQGEVWGTAGEATLRLRGLDVAKRIQGSHMTPGAPGSQTSS